MKEKTMGSLVKIPLIIINGHTASTLGTSKDQQKNFSSPTRWITTQKNPNNYLGRQ